jgi:hypothetical protein
MVTYQENPMVGPRILLLLVCGFLLHGEELTADDIKQIIAAERSAVICDELKHYKPSEALKIVLNLTMGDGQQHRIETTGRQWYVKGDRVVQEMVVGPEKIHFIVGWNAAGYYESWQGSASGVIHGTGVKLGDHLTWTNEQIISGQKCRMTEIEKISADGIDWRAVVMNNDTLVYINVGSVRW